MRWKSSKRPHQSKSKASMTPRSIPPSASQVYQAMPVSRRMLADNVYLYVTHQEVMGKSATINQLTGLLAQLNIHDVIRTIAAINNLYSPTPAKSITQIRSEQIWLAKQLFPKEILEKFNASPFGRDNTIALFHHQQQLYLLREALTSCQHDGGLPWETTAHHIFGNACLMVNDLLGRKTPIEPKDGNVTLAHMIIPNLEISADHEPVSLIGRAVQLWINIPEEESLKRYSDHIDFKQVFRDAYHIDLEAFLRVLFVIFAQAFRDDTDYNQPWAHFVINLEKTFENTQYDKDTLRRAMKVISSPLAEFGAYIHEQPTQSVRHDFTSLQRYPGIEVEDGIYVIYDRMLLLRFFTAGIWWRIHDALPVEKQGDFKSFFGKVFEMYVGRVLSHVCNAVRSKVKHNLILNPRFNASTEVCDALLIYDDTWILVESKAVLFTPRAKYIDDSSEFQRQLDERLFGKPEDKKNKGISQLAHSIRKLAGGEKVMNTDLDFAKAKNVYMVIVSYDIAATGKFTAAYLDKKMRDTFGELPPNCPNVLPLIIIGPTDLEAFTSIGQRNPLHHLLASYRHNALPLTSFKDHMFAVRQRDINIDETFSLDNYHAIHESVVADFQK
jgi:hypothetical protein